MIEHGPRYINQEPFTHSTIGASFHQLIQRKRLDRTAIAELANLSRSEIDQVIGGKRIPTSHIIADLCDALRIDSMDPLRNIFLLKAAHETIKKAKEKRKQTNLNNFQPLEPPENLDVPNAKLTYMIWTLVRIYDISEEEFAARSDINKSSLIKIREEKRSPSFFLLANMCDGLGIPENHPVRDKLLLRLAHDQIEKHRSHRDTTSE